MDKHSYTRSEGVSRVKVVQEEPKQETVLLISLKNTIIKVQGSVSGKEYVFPHAGVTIPVDAEDAPELLAKSRNPCNCSGGKSSPYFAIAN